MVTKEEVASVLEPMGAEIKRIDDATIGEVVGVAQALDELRRALDEVDRCLDTREFEKAAALGYGSVASSFIFLQRTLGGINERSMDKQGVVQEIARRLRCPYEEAEPHVNALMHSTKPRPEDDGCEDNAEPSASSLEEIPDVDLSKAERLSRGTHAKHTGETAANSLLHALRKRARWRRIERRARAKEHSRAPELASVLAAARSKLEGAVFELCDAHQNMGRRAGADERTASEYGTFDMLDDVAARLLLVLVNAIGKGPDGIDLAATMLNEIVGGAVQAFERGYGGEGLSEESRGAADRKVIDPEQPER